MAAGKEEQRVRYGTARYGTATEGCFKLDSGKQEKWMWRGQILYFCCNYPNSKLILCRQKGERERAGRREGWKRELDRAKEKERESKQVAAIFEGDGLSRPRAFSNKESQWWSASDTKSPLLTPTWPPFTHSLPLPFLSLCLSLSLSLSLSLYLPLSLFLGHGFFSFSISTLPRLSYEGETAAGKISVLLKIVKSGLVEDCTHNLRTGLTLASDTYFKAMMCSTSLFENVCMCVCACVCVCVCVCVLAHACEFLGV